MSLIAAMLSLLLATQDQTPKTDPLLQRELGAFLAHVKAARFAAAYAQMSTAAKKTFGPAQFSAYIASRQRALGPLLDVQNIRVSNAVETEHGMTIYEADVRFEKGTSPAWFVLTREDAGWRIEKFGFDMPEGKVTTYQADEMLPVAHDMLAAVKAEGLAALADRFSAKDLAEVNQTVDTARAGMTMLATIAGRLESYTLGKPASDADETNCSTVQGEAKFTNGPAAVTMRLCWADGVWRLRHAQITPDMNPVVLERSLEYSLQGEVTAKCPRNAAFPVGGQIVCRVTPRGEPAQDVTILRTTESGWKIVGLAEAKE